VTALTSREHPAADNRGMRKRDKENRDATWFRSPERVFCLNGAWYYQTREDDHGPFPTRAAAERDLARYVEEMQFLENVTDGAPPPPDSDEATPGFADFTLADKD